MDVIHNRNKTRKSLLAAMATPLALIPATSQAAVVGLADASLTGIEEAVETTNIVGEDSIYIAGTITFNAVDTTGSVVLTEVQIAGTTEAYRIGQLNNTDDFANIRPTVSVLDDTLTVGESHRVVIKMDTLTGAFSVWLDPNLGQKHSHCFLLQNLPANCDTEETNTRTNN